MARYSIVCTRHVETYEATTFEVDADTMSEAVDLGREECQDAYWTPMERKVSVGAVIPTLVRSA